VVVLAIVGLLVRQLTGAGGAPPIWDEPVMKPVIDAILLDGWTVRTMIDYEDTKGPAFFWLYAATAELIGGDLGRLRAVSLLLFVLTGAALGPLMAWCGLRAPQVVLASLLFAMLPYNALLGQLFMSEPSFVLGSVLLCWAFTRAFGREESEERRVLGPIVCGVLLAVLLHHRPHAAALAAGIAGVSLLRDGMRSWPWWLACALAGASRVPLLLRWDGLVSPTYQYSAGLGFRIDSLAYLAMAILPCTAVFLYAALAGGTRRAPWPLLAAAAAAGGLLGWLRPPDLAAVTQEKDLPLYLGAVATALRPSFESPSLYVPVVAALVAMSFASMAALAWLALMRPRDGTDAVTGQLAAITLIAGWGLYAFTSGCVFDRYILPYLVLLPVLWVTRLPLWLTAAQLAALVVFAAVHAGRWLG
jgi:hypothetical protein